MHESRTRTVPCVWLVQRHSEPRLRDLSATNRGLSRETDEDETLHPSKMHRLLIRGASKRQPPMLIHQATTLPNSILLQYTPNTTSSDPSRATGIQAIRLNDHRSLNTIHPIHLPPSSLRLASRRRNLGSVFGFRVEKSNHFKTRLSCMEPPIWMIPSLSVPLSFGLWLLRILFLPRQLQSQSSENLVHYSPELHMTHHPVPTRIWLQMSFHMSFHYH